MSGVSSSKRILRTTVAAAAAGAVVLSPLAPLAEEFGASVAPIEIRVGANPRFTRVEFAGVIGARSQVRREGTGRTDWQMCPMFCGMHFN